MGVSQIGFPQNTVYRSRVQTSETLPVTLQASKYGIFSFDISAGDGITPLGIVGWGCNETSQTFIHEYFMDTNGQTAKLYLKNPYSTDVSITELWIDVLYTKIGLDMSEVTVVDNLTTDSGLDALSARQGKVLNDSLAIARKSTAGFSTSFSVDLGASNYRLNITCPLYSTFFFYGVDGATPIAYIVFSGGTSSAIATCLSAQNPCTFSRSNGVTTIKFNAAWSNVTVIGRSNMTYTLSA